MTSNLSRPAVDYPITNLPNLSRRAVDYQLLQGGPMRKPQPWSVLRERLRSLRDQLCLKGHLDIISMSCSYTPAALQARLDWVNANLQWFDLMHGIGAYDFNHAFARINLNAPW